MLSIGEFARLGGVTARTLRHYGELGLIHPAKIDDSTGYRFYALDQLGDLRRILALRDLGIGLDEIGSLLADDLSVEQLRGMLRLRQADIAAAIGEQQAQLRRVEAHLDAIERGEGMRTIDVVVKRTDPLRVAVATGRAPGFGYENMHPIFEEQMPRVWSALVDQGAGPGMGVAFYEEDVATGDGIVHLGFAIGDQRVEPTAHVHVEDLPVIEVASTIHKGPMTDIADDFMALVRWIESSGHQIDHAYDPKVGIARMGRELYWEVGEGRRPIVTELQIPIAPAG